MTETKRVLLATKFPEQFIRDTIVPGLRAIGVEVSRVVGVDFEGQIRDVDAVAFMFQMCSHVAHDTFKARAKAAGVPFLLLTRQSADWPRAFKQAGIELSLRPVDPTPLPAPDLPKKNGAGVIVANGAPLLPPPAPVIPDPKEAVPFGEALKAFRKRESAGQGVIADLCGVSQGLVSHWESGAMPIAPACYEKLCALSPDLAAALPPEFTTRSGRPTKAETRKPAAAKAPVPPKANGSNGHRAAPLDGLRLAARALGIVGPLTITVDDAESEVRVGAEQWPGASPDEAVETARKALDDRLRDLLRRVEAARASLGGAL